LPPGSPEAPCRQQLKLMSARRPGAYCICNLLRLKTRRLGRFLKKTQSTQNNKLKVLSESHVDSVSTRAGARRGMAPLCAAASYSTEYNSIRAFLTWGIRALLNIPLALQQGQAQAPPHHALIFPGVFDFPLASFLPPLTEIRRFSKFCHFAGALPLCRGTGGADGHCRRSRWHPRMAPDPDGDCAEAGPLTSATPGTSRPSTKPRISYSVEYATGSTRLK
jgi:hypothetical protein